MEAREVDLSRLPLPWKPITDEQNDVELQDAWVYWRTLHPDMAPSISAELQREVSEAHPLYRVECRPFAWDADAWKDFAFLTARPDIPVVLVHLTFYQETEPFLPATWDYESVEAFIEYRVQVEEQKRRRRLLNVSQQGT